MSVEKFSPDTVNHRFFLGRGFGDGSLGAHNLPLVLLLACFAVFVLIGLGCAIFSQNLERIITLNMLKYIQN